MLNESETINGVAGLTFFPRSQDGERPVPADYQPRFLSLHAHVAIRIPEDEDSAEEQKNQSRCFLVWLQSSLSLEDTAWPVLISQQGHDTCFPACLSAPVWLRSRFLKLERTEWAGLQPQTWGGGGGEERGGSETQGRPQATAGTV